MKNFSNIELLIPTWEYRTGYGYWGNYDYGSDDNYSLSFWLSLRCIVPGDVYFYLDENCRSIQATGVHVWVSVEGAVSIDLRMFDLRSMTLREGVHHVDVLKHLIARAKDYEFNNSTRGSDLHTELTKVTDALGIKRSLVYASAVGGHDTYAPVGLAIKRISDCIDERLSRMKRLQAA